MFQKLCPIETGDLRLRGKCSWRSGLSVLLLTQTEHFASLLYSIISLATRCAMPGFRMHLRARGKVAQVFKILSDAPQHPVSNRELNASTVWLYFISFFRKCWFKVQPKCSCLSNTSIKTAAGPSVNICRLQRLHGIHEPVPGFK